VKKLISEKTTMNIASKEATLTTEVSQQHPVHGYN
jgi:hypothetical protein